MTEQRKPKHIAIIMDGNGRWAKMRNMPRSYGHKCGKQAVLSTIEACLDEHIEVLSLFAFSTENWKRDREEVDTLFSILRSFMNEFSGEAEKRNVRITVMGDVEKLPEDLSLAITRAVEKTKNNDALTVNIGLNYGGRAEIVRAVNLAVRNGKEISEEELSSLLYTNGLPDPDLVIRTSGEERLSNFMIYQSAYAELYFTDVLWPDFNRDELDKAIADYGKRDRRFGKAK